MKTKEFTINKSTVECYKIRHSSGLYWADIVIDAKGEAGRIQIASDFGDWQYYWSHCGCPFKEFLIRLDKDYFARKVGAKSYFSAEENIKALKEYLEDSDNRAALSELSDLEKEVVDDVQSFWCYLKDYPNLCETSYDFETIRTYDPGFREFWENVWPVFVEELKKEI